MRRLSVVFAILVFAVGCSDQPYSEGYREGFIQKLSHKGPTGYKSWEGFMLVGQTGAMSEWAFSVEDAAIDPDSGKKVTEAIQNVQSDERVRLHYQQKTQTNGSFSYDTPYRIIRVERITKPKPSKEK